MNSKKSYKEKGSAAYLLIVSLGILAIVAFFAVSTYAPFKNKLFGMLYSKQLSFASTNPISPTPTPAPVALTLTPNWVAGSIPQGAVVQVATLSSLGANGFTFYGYPTSYGPGINWQEASGGITPGTSQKIHIQVNSNTPIGNYTGTGTLLNPANNGKFLFPVDINVVSSKFRLAAIPYPIKVSVTQGSTQKALVIYNLNASASGFSMIGYPSPYGTGVNWSPSSGGLQPNGKVDINVQANTNAKPGTYTGAAVILDNTSKLQISVPISLTVISSLTPTPVPTFVCTVCGADVNKDGNVNITDFSQISGCFNQPASTVLSNGVACLPADIDKSGFVDQPDADCVEAMFGKQCSKNPSNP